MSCSTTGTLEDLARATERTKSYVMLEALRKLGSDEHSPVNVFPSALPFSA